VAKRIVRAILFTDVKRLCVATKQDQSENFGPHLEHGPLIKNICSVLLSTLKEEVMTCIIEFGDRKDVKVKAKDPRFLIKETAILKHLAVV
jgi:hypothetical protein